MTFIDKQVTRLLMRHGSKDKHELYFVKEMYDIFIIEIAASMGHVNEL